MQLLLQWYVARTLSQLGAHTLSPGPSSSWSQPLLMTHALVRPSVVWTLINFHWSVHWLRKAQIGCKRLKPLDYYIRPLPPASTKANPLKGCLSTWLRAVNGWPQLDRSNRIFRTLIEHFVSCLPCHPLVLRAWALHTFSSLHVFAAHGCIRLFAQRDEGEFGTVLLRPLL